MAMDAVYPNRTGRLPAVKWYDPPVDWISFAAGALTALVSGGVLFAVMYVRLERQRARALFAIVEAPSGKQTRRLRAREIDDLVDESKD